jgi:hypothetical protein
MNRARARRIALAWRRYDKRFPDMRISLGHSMGHHWWLRAHRKRRKP